LLSIISIFEGTITINRKKRIVGCDKVVKNFDKKDDNITQLSHHENEANLLKILASHRI
jgi:hypothetical protein